MSGPPAGVSVIIPALNASETLGDALDSVLAQTWRHWEAIVVDDGSSDDTVALAARYSTRDHRIRVARGMGPPAGTSAARNRGIALAHFDRLLFLDADDWLSPPHLERLAGALDLHPDADIAYCGWIRVARDGTRFGESLWRESDDAFAAFAIGCPPVLHACLVRRSLVDQLGGFDVSLWWCEDWDLWQRIARTGARFQAVDVVLAPYRMRPDSKSLNTMGILADGLRVIAQGHAPDPRVPKADPRYAEGVPPAGLARARLLYATGVAGIEVGRGQDARPMLAAVSDDRDPDLNPVWVAEGIFDNALLPSCRTPDAWAELWPALERRVDEFLVALEHQAMAPALAQRTRSVLERMILGHAKISDNRTVGATHATRIEVTAPIPDRVAPPGARRLLCAVEVEGAALGFLELPTCGGFIPSAVIADAIAAEFAWPILGHFFARTRYRQLDRRSAIQRLRSWWKGRRNKVDPADPGDGAPLHERMGWEVFLQELWGRRQWENARFYDPDVADARGAPRRAVDGRLRIEASADLPDVEAAGAALEIVPTVGGVPLGVIPVPVTDGTIPAARLRHAIVTATGFELCRVAVREGVLGRPLTDEPTSLRDRLAAAAVLQEPDTHDAEHPPRWLHELKPAPVSDGGVVALGRHAAGPTGTSVSRRAVLPAAAAAELCEAASTTGQAVIRIGATGGAPACVVYAPDLIESRGASRSPLPDRSVSGAAAAGPARQRVHGRHHFEALFAARPDPWSYTTPYERTKYEQTLSLLPTTPVHRALELACAEGHFTAQLATRVDELLAADISQIALDRAAERCAELANVRFQRLDLTVDALPTHCDLIVCSEVLYYVGDRAALRAVGRKLAEALAPGGHLITAHANLVTDDPTAPGFDWGLPFGALGIGDTLAEVPGLHLLREIRTPLYRVQKFQRVEDGAPAVTPERVAVPQPTPPPPSAAASVRWPGGRAPAPPELRHAVTDRLPILTYHRVAPAGAPALRRWRLTPEAFAEQLGYLREAGFYGVSLERWRQAADARTPLPGRAVLLTFDDGYRDFATHAWPLLQAHGFSATVFLVAEHVGGFNAWDQALGEGVPLLDWEEVGALERAGVEFGSHSASHPRLTSLTHADVVREAARSRAILARHLGRAPTAFAYPYGDSDAAVQHLVGACGYVYGLTCRTDAARFRDPLLALPRLEVRGTDTLPDFVAKLPA